MEPKVTFLEEKQAPSVGSMILYLLDLSFSRNTDFPEPKDDQRSTVSTHKDDLENILVATVLRLLVAGVHGFGGTQTPQLVEQLARGTGRFLIHLLYECILIKAVKLIYLYRSKQVNPLPLSILKTCPHHSFITTFPETYCKFLATFHCFFPEQHFTIVLFSIFYFLNCFDFSFIFVLLFYCVIWQCQCYLKMKNIFIVLLLNNCQKTGKNYLRNAILHRLFKKMWNSYKIFKSHHVSI